MAGESLGGGIAAFERALALEAERGGAVDGGVHAAVVGEGLRVGVFEARSGCLEGSCFVLIFVGPGVGVEIRRRHLVGSCAVSRGGNDGGPRTVHSHLVGDAVLVIGGGRALGGGRRVRVDG